MKFISIGRIVGTYGLKGMVKVQLNSNHNDTSQLFNQMEYLLLTLNGELKRSLKIEEVRVHNNFLVMQLQGIDSIDNAKKLKGHNVSITEDMLPKAENDEVYWFEIENLPVLTSDKRHIGKLIDIMEAGGKDVFRIALNNGKYALISNNRDHVLYINTEDKYIVISETGLVYEDL